jgi:NTE family protein
MMSAKADDNHDKTAIVLQGGGARGAYQVGAVKAIAEIMRRRRSPFQIVCGASVGAINAASLATTACDFRAGARRNEALWRSLHSGAVYDTRALPLLATTLRWASTVLLGHFGVRASGGFLDYEPLRRLLTQQFDRKHLDRAIRTGALHAFCISASSYSDGCAVTFFEGPPNATGWARARRRGALLAITPDHLLASAALPVVFAPVRLQDGYYGDGSLRLTAPLSPAIHTGATRILVITTRDNLGITPDQAAPQSAPTIGNIIGHTLDILFNDNLEADHERMTRINHTLSLLTPDAQTRTPLRRIETILLSPSRDLREVVKQHNATVPLAIRLLMRSLGAWGGDGRLESYLLFEPAYIGALIDLGYTDTMQRKDEVRAFLQA